MASSTIQHSLQSVVEALDAKIAQLEANKSQVEARVRKGHQLETNTTALNQINDSLCAAKAARRMMTDSCCSTYNCNFNWEP